jgi:DNA ligase-1
MRLRDDKGWEEASTSAQFAEMYRKQIKEAPARAAPGEVVIRKNSEERDVPNPSSDPIELDDDEQAEDEEEDED